MPLVPGYNFVRAGAARAFIEAYQLEYAGEGLESVSVVEFIRMAQHRQPPKHRCLLEGVIEERRSRGRSLLQGFDDRIRDHLQIAEARAREALYRRTSLLRDFVLGSLAAHGASVAEEEPGLYRFSTPSQFILGASELLDAEYRGTFTKDERETVAYLTKWHPLIRTALDVHLKAGQRTAVRLSYTGNHNIHGMDELVGRGGWWVNFRVCFTGFETEDHVLQLGLVQANDGWLPSDLASENLHRITLGPSAWSPTWPLPDGSVVERWLSERVSALEDESLERNAQYYVERRSVIDKFYGAKGDGEILAEMRHSVEEKRRQVDELQDQIESSTSMTRKMSLMREQDKLNDDLFQLQQRMQTEQLASFGAKRKALQELEQLRELSHAVELISVAQWTMV